MSELDTGGPKASSTAVKSKNQRFVDNRHKNTINDTFNSIFSNELTDSDLLKKTFSEMSNNKQNVEMETMYSSLSGQSSLGILELENMSDIGSINKRETFPFNSQPVLQHRLSQATQARNNLARASSTKSIFNDNDKSVRISLTNINNAFEDMLKQNMDNSCSSFSNEDFISGNEFENNLAEIEKINRKEFGSLSESRFNFTLDGEKQSIGNGSFAAKYFAAKSVPVEDLSKIFPKRQKNNETITEGFKEKHCSFSLLNELPNDNQKHQEEQTPIGYKTVSSITSWTDSHVSNNVLNLTSLSNISEVLTSQINSTNSKELTKALLSGDLSDDKLLNEPHQFLQRRFSTSTRFSNSSQYLEHAEISFPSLENVSLVSPQKNVLNINDNHLKVNSKQKYDNDKYENLTTQGTIVKDLSIKIDKKQAKKKLNNNCNFVLTPKSGFFKNCISEESILENNIDLSNFSILTNNHITETSLNKSTNVSKSVYCNETLCEDKLSQSQAQYYRTDSKLLEVGDVCIGTYSQAVIILENRLTIDVEYTLHLLNVSLNYSKNDTFIENKPIGPNVATVICSDKVCTIPALSEASFTIGIIPLISGSISIHIKLESNNISQEIDRNIQVYSFEPQVSWVNNSFGSIDFGLLPELSQKSLPIKLLNNGIFHVPIKFILNQDGCEDIIQAKAIINPSELWQCDVNIFTPSFSKNNSKTNTISGRLQIVLDSIEELSNNYSPLLYCSNLSGRIGLTDVSFDQNPLILKKNGKSTLNGVLEISNNSELPISLSVRKNIKHCSEFIFQPDKLQLAVNEKAKMNIVYSPSKSSNYFKETSICLQLVSSQKQFFIKINCIESNSEFQQSSPLSSRPISPWSTSSSSAVGQLELESTCSSLIWGSVPTNTKSVQVFTLRNRGSHKEKLLLSIRDNRNCFKLISSGENQVSEMKLLLEPMESQKLSVALISTSNEGQTYGEIVIQRIRSSEKRVIALSGYCGHSVVTIQGAFEDNFGNMWLYPNAQLMTAQFSITNSGNTTAFVKISQENSLEDIIQPNEFLLKKGETTVVEVTIVMSPERLEMLTEQDSNSKIININKISLIYGDEVSRVRVSRLWNKIKNEKKKLYPDKRRLNKISNMFNGVHYANVNHLADSEKCLLKLWKTGITEDKIVILMQRSDLESLLCDTTTVFSELETTVINRLSF